MLVLTINWLSALVLGVGVGIRTGEDLVSEQKINSDSRGALATGNLESPAAIPAMPCCLRMGCKARHFKMLRCWKLGWTYGFDMFWDMGTQEWGRGSLIPGSCCPRISKSQVCSWVCNQCIRDSPGSETKPKTFGSGSCNLAQQEIWCLGWGIKFLQSQSRHSFNVY